MPDQFNISLCKYTHGLGSYGHLPLSEDSQVALEQVLLRVYKFSLVSIMPLIPHTAIHVTQMLHILTVTATENTSFS